MASPKGRVLSSRGSPNWLHGHHWGERGVAYYEGWKTSELGQGADVDHWLVMCGTVPPPSLRGLPPPPRYGNHLEDSLVLILPGLANFPN